MYSNESPVISGVLQGSVLGPNLFIVIVNDLSDHIQSSLWTFADDTKIYHPILSDVDHTMLQNNLDYFMQWNKTWWGSLNIPKSKYLSLGSSDGSPSGSSYTLTVKSDDMEIQEYSEERDLSITFLSNLKFSKHINLSIMKANRMVEIIKRTFLHLTPTVFHKLYISLVRPHLDYASIIWNPYLLKDIGALEAVQIRATKMVRDLNRLTYDERFQVLNLPSLYYRKKRMDMITTHKIIRGLVEVPRQDIFTIKL